MAVYDNYVDTKILAGRIPGPLAGGYKELCFAGSFDTTAAHDANSIYRIIKGIPATAVPIYLWIYSDGVTGMNDVDVGLYKTGAGGAAVSAEALASTLDLSSAVLRTAPKDGLGNLTNTNWFSMLYELAGETTRSHQPCYDIGLKSVADLSEADTISFVAKFAMA